MSFEKRRPTAQQHCKRTTIYDEFALSAIRLKVHDFYRRGEVPTAPKVTMALMNDEDLPSVSVWTVRRILHDLLFKYIKNKRKSILLDQEDIVRWRRCYLRSMKTFRLKNRNIIYLDETWVNAGITVPKHWQDTTITSPRDAFLRGLTVGLPHTFGKGSRLIILYTGGEKGFVPGCLMIFQSKCKAGDYHEDMDGKCFQNWFTTNLLPALPPNTVIVMDNASYHNVRKHPFPTMHWLKKNIQQWLTDKGIAWQNSLIKQELIALAQPFKAECNRYIINELAMEAGHEIVRLPPYHCELNPIEMVWADIKQHVAKLNTTFKIQDVLQLTKDAFYSFGEHKWPNYVQHVIKVEEEMWQLDHMMEETVEELVITTTGETSSESEDGN